MVERLRDVPAARALRVRFLAIQKLLQLFPGVRTLEYYAYLWADQHAALMLALERTNAPLGVDPTCHELDPNRQPLVLPRLPAKTLFNLPMIW